jgi:hypothetical protein
MVGGYLGGTETSAVSCGGRPAILYIPLQFWFCRNPGLALPLIALQYHEVRINVTLNPAVDLVTGTAGTSGSVSTNAVLLPQLTDMSLYIDYIYLDVDERRRFAQQSHEYLIDQLQFGLQQTITTSSARIDLTLNHPVKELVWVFQDARKTDCASNLTTNAGFTQPFSYDDIVNRARLQINGQDRFDERYGDYFWKVQPYQHHTGGAFWPVRAQVTTLATTTITITAANASVNGDVLTIDAGAGGLPTGAGPYIAEGALVTSATVGIFAPGTIISAFGTGSGAAGTYNLSEPALVNGTLSSNLIITLPNVNYAPHLNPINVYSFALRPEEHQPSGTCNFSRIDNAVLQLVLSSPTVSGTATAKVRVYAVNYNVLRVMTGINSTLCQKTTRHRHQALSVRISFVPLKIQKKASC